MTQDVKMKKILEYPMAVSVQMRRKHLKNLVVALAEEETTNRTKQTTIIERTGSLIQVKDVLVDLVIEKTEVKEVEVLVDPEMRNVGVAEVVVVEDVEEEEALDVDGVDENMTDTVEVIERKCFSQN